MVQLLMAALIAASTPAAAPDLGPPPKTTIHIKNFAFVPATVRVRAGDAVAFVNDDEEPHTVTASNRSFDSGGLDTSDTWKHRFGKPGSYAYLCTVHPQMRGTIVVIARDAKEKRP